MYFSLTANKRNIKCFEKNIYFILFTLEGAHADAIQAGDNNTFEMNIDSTFKGTVNVVQGGNGNKFILYHLKNRIECTPTRYGNYDKLENCKICNIAFSFYSHNRF